MPSPREWIHRLWGTLRGRRSDADLEQELRLHVELAAEDARRRGDPHVEAVRAARIRSGGVAQAMDALRDQRGLPWLDALASDVVFGWRQLNKHRTASAAAILSLGLAIGATMSAFRLVDALLLRPLFVAEPERLFGVATTFVDADNRPDFSDDFDYPTYRDYSKAVGEKADVMVVGMAARQPIVVGSGDEPESVIRQFVSGNVFGSLGLQPALGRLLTPRDDVVPGGHPVAVVSHEYWTRRFGSDRAIVGTTFRIGNRQFEIIGVAPGGFTGTEPGSVTDLFLPAMMNAQAINSPGWSWFRIWVRPRRDVSAEQVRQMLQARFRASHEERLKDFPADTPKERIDAYLREDVRLLPAGSGVSGMQKTFRRPLLILGALAAFVLLIACANVANLLIAQALSRTREMALRVSIGAARWRLIQLVLVESLLLALFASTAGALFASWSAPVVVAMLAPIERPVRIIFHADWRALAFGLTLAFTVTVLFGLAPALRASSVKPLGAWKGEEDPQAQRRLTNALIAAQVAFCVFLLFVAGLFVGTFERLASEPLGFSDHNVVVVQTETRAAQPVEIWRQVGDHLRRMPGIESVAVAGWAPLSGNRWRAAVRLPAGSFGGNAPYFVSISSGYFETLRIGMPGGRDFRSGDVQPRANDGQVPIAGVGIVNEAFARMYFEGQDPVGKRVSVRQAKDVEASMEIVGLVRDAAYDTVREPIRPTVYVPLEPRNNVALMIRTANDPMRLAAAFRREVPRARPDLRVRAVEPLTALVRQQMIRERLLATLSAFFALVALLLAGIGLYGVMNYAVIRRRREIGIRMALGARAAHVVRHVTLQMTAIVCVGCLAGVAGGIAFGRVVGALLFRMTPTDPAAIFIPMVALAAAAALAAVPPAVRAVRTDPAQALRTD